MDKANLKFIYYFRPTEEWSKIYNEREKEIKELYEEYRNLILAINDKEIINSINDFLVVKYGKEMTNYLYHYVLLHIDEKNV